MKSTLIRVGALVALLGTLAFASASHAQSPDGDDVQQTVVRVAYFSGEVSYLRGDDPDDWQPASLNFPMTLGDRLYTAKGSRLELQTEGGVIYLAPETDLAALNLTYEVKQFSLGVGSASFRIRQIGSGESFEVDTPNAAVTFDRAGEYRINVDRDGNTRVIVNRGYAHVAAAGGEVPLDAGRLMAIDGIDSPVYDVTSLPRPDSWDQWVLTRSRPSHDNASRRYVSAEISGVDDLDQSGHWSEIPEYGNVWSPANVSADWQPYRAGRWAWQDPWGWSWVSNESWGWAPYHYGRWVTSQSRWYWVPVGPSVRTVRYAPALVAFVGGPGFSASVTVGGGGNVGWFPLAPRDPFLPWWGSRARQTNVTNVTNVTYVNRTYVTVVNQNTFISGAPVARNTVHDARVIREISAAPVVHGPLQIVPVASSIRVSERAGPAPRPPAALLTRPVVTRMAPPPAPVSFHQKENLIRENRGAPVQAAEAARLAPESRATRPTRSVVAEPGRVTLAPKNAGAGGPVPVPVTRGVAQAKNAPVQQQQQQQQQLDAGKAQKQQQQQAQEAESARVKQQQGVDARKAQEAENARKAQQQQLDAGKAQKQQQQQAQEAESARVKQQQGVDARKAQEAENARKAQQQQLDAGKAQKQQQQQAQEAESARVKQQQGVDARKAQEAENARRAQQQQLDAGKAQKQQQQQAQEAESARVKQQQGVDARKAQEAENARKAQQQQLDAGKAQKQQQQAQEAENARKAQQQQLDAGKAQKQQQQAQEAENARKAQQQQIDTRKAQEAENARKAQQQQQQAQQAENARKAQQQQVDTRKAQEAENARKAQQQQVDARKAQEAAQAKAKAPDPKKAEQDKKDKEKKDQPDEKKN